MRQSTNEHQKTLESKYIKNEKTSSHINLGSLEKN